MALKRLTLNQRFILINTAVSILLGILIWFLLSESSKRENLISIKESIKLEMESSVEKMVSSYQESLKKAEEFHQYIIQKMLYSTVEDFYFLTQLYYQDVVKKRIPEKSAKERLIKLFNQRKIGKSGYIYVISNQGNIISHPNSDLIGKNLDISEKKYEFIRSQIKNAKKDHDLAYIEYDWRNPGEEKVRPKALAQVYFKRWNWIISVNAYKSDFESLVDRQYKLKLFQDLRAEALKVTLGKKGFIYFVSSDDSQTLDFEGNIIESRKKGEIILHPESAFEKKQLKEIDEKLSQEIFSQKEGFLQYKSGGREKITIYKYYESLKWIAVLSAYPDEYFIPGKEYRFDTPFLILLLFLALNLAANIVFFYRYVIRVIQKVRLKLNAVADGDLTIEQSFPKTHDNIGMMLVSINQMIANLEEIVKKILISTSDMYHSIEEVSTGNNDLSERTEKQAVSLEELAASIEEFTSIIKSNVLNADKANNLAQEAKLSAEKGGEIVFDAIASMQEIEKSSFEIENINNVIEEIAFQTNLLALNASVEAARAGENGRGFAVVAMEIRNLARKTSVFAKQISILIKNTVENIEKGNNLVNQSGEALQEIIDIITNTTNLISEVYAGSEEQIKGIEEINRAMLQLEEINNQNASLAERVSVNSEDMLGKMIVLRSIIKFFHLRKEILEQVKIIHKSNRKEKEQKNNNGFISSQDDQKSAFKNEEFEEF